MLSDRMRRDSSVMLLAAALQCSSGIGTDPSSPSCQRGGSWTDQRRGRTAWLELRSPASTWTSFVTITITTVLGDDLIHPVATQTTTHNPYVLTVPGPTAGAPAGPVSEVPIASVSSSSRTSSANSTGGRTTSNYSSSLTLTVSAQTSASTPAWGSSTSTGKTANLTTSASSSTLRPDISSESSSSVVSVSSAVETEPSNTPVYPAESTASTAQTPHSAGDGHPLESGQVAAIAVGLVAFVAFIIVVVYLARWYFLYRRRYLAEKRHGLGDMAVVSQAAQGGTGGGAEMTYSQGSAGSRNGVGGGLHDGEFRIVIQPTPQATFLNRGLWPSPPGYTERYAYFSGRSTTTTEGDNSTDHGQWSRGTEHGSGRSRTTR